MEREHTVRQRAELAHDLPEGIYLEVFARRAQADRMSALLNLLRRCSEQRR
jgi:hypothetical protein